MGIFFLWRENKELRTTCAEAERKHFEKRLEDLQKVLTALERATTTGAALAQTVEARTGAIDNLTAGLAALVHSTETHRQRFMDQTNRLEKTVEDFDTKIDLLLRSPPSDGRVR
jgi:hypothetical protein